MIAITKGVLVIRATNGKKSSSSNNFLLLSRRESERHDLIWTGQMTVLFVCGFLDLGFRVSLGFGFSGGILCNLTVLHTRLC